MSGKLAWSIGLALALIGVAMFAFGYTKAQPDSELESALKRMPDVSRIPPRKAIERLAADREERVNEVKLRQSELWTAVGKDPNERIFPPYRRTGDAFATQHWPQIERSLQEDLNKITKRPPDIDPATGRVGIAASTVMPAPFKNLSDKINEPGEWSANDSYLGRIAATVCRRFVDAALAAKAANPDDYFEVQTFLTTDANIRLEAAVPVKDYGEMDAFQRREMQIMFRASAAVSQHIIREMSKTELKPPLLRLRAINAYPAMTTPGILVEPEPKALREFLDSLPSNRRNELAGIEEAVAADDEGLKAWAESGVIKERLQRLVDLHPSAMRPATAAEVRLTVQILEPRLGAPLLTPLEKVREGLPAAQQ